MDRRKSSNYLGIASRLSFGKSSSSSVAKNHFRWNHTTSKSFKNQFHSKHPKHSSDLPLYTPQYTNSQKRPSSKMSSSSLSSPKRKHPGDDTPRPFKKLMVEVTGLEDDPAMEDITTRTLSTITTSEVDLYVRRRKISRYANLIRRKQAMVNPKLKTTPLFLLIIFVEQESPGRLGGHACFFPARVAQLHGSYMLPTIAAASPPSSTKICALA